MPPISPLNPALEKIWKAYSEDIGRSLIHLGALGWLLSAAAQVTMIAKNKDIDKKEKQFLIPQEIADGVINVGLYYTICKGIKKGCEMMLENGVIMTKKSFDTIMQIKQSSQSVKDFVRGTTEYFYHSGLLKKKNSVGRLTDFYTTLVNLLDKKTNSFDDILKHNETLRETFGYYVDIVNKNKTKKFINRALKNFKCYKNGIGVVAAVGASVLACNVITPIGRNITANMFQSDAKKRTAKNHPVQMSEVKKQSPNWDFYKNSSSTAYNGFKI